MCEAIKNYVLKPENTRAAPGETVSIKYGVRRTKFILQKSRMTIAQEFLSAYSDCDCSFKASTVVREFPQNAVTDSSRDRKRPAVRTTAIFVELSKSYMPKESASMSALHSDACVQ